MRSFIPLIALIAPLVSAVSITSPALNSTYAAGSTVTVEWTTVDTDPTHLSLYLWNFFSWPPTYVPLATDVPTADQSYSVQIPCDTNPEWGYQISAINGTNVYIIYAQGERFTISKPLDGANCVDPAPIPSPSTCAAVSTVYVTVSPTGSSSSVLHHSSHGFHSSHHHLHSTHVLPAPSSTTATSSSSSSRYVKPGIVPKTIGWCSDYAHPVTLDKVPTTTPAVNDDADVPQPWVTSPPRKVKTITTTVAVTASWGDDRCAFV
ncbi:GPI anchored serine-threonine rich family protein [Aspergillus clavatus NRRL 1]|uniref:Extracellular proline-serine rich protein n=1 Tax=Aspergillus clavatus (strain ATCC 1007 / CBS 513.65 / DSM 816 / NCTC 3887 / NRRL 1 / QM 1276 / 107) TaxID=344612 RepID=A1CN63_ASPCL|nr:extracellular proline-serine rich protein [Aspergillus clavatus NRRL 1]EAW07084.1 extracellular proline-serine rich protein [Aspergillus clavatus NRRL 1]